MIDVEIQDLEDFVMVYFRIDYYNLIVKKHMMVSLAMNQLEYVIKELRRRLDERHVKYCMVSSDDRFSSVVSLTFEKPEWWNDEVQKQFLLGDGNGKTEGHEEKTEEGRSGDSGNGGNAGQAVRIRFTGGSGGDDQ